MEINRRWRVAFTLVISRRTPVHGCGVASCRDCDSNQAPSVYEVIVASLDFRQDSIVSVVTCWCLLNLSLATGLELWNRKSLRLFEWLPVVKHRTRLATVLQR